MDPNSGDALLKSSYNKPADARTTNTIGLEVKGLLGLPQEDMTFSLKPPFKKPRKYYVTVTVGKTLYETDRSAAEGQRVEWNEIFYFDAVETSIVTFKLYAVYRTKANKLLGVFSALLAALLAQKIDVNDLYTTHLLTNTSRKQHGNESLEIIIAVKPAVTKMAETANVVAQANHGANALQPSTILESVDATISIVAGVADNTKNFTDVSKSLLDKVDVFVKMVDGLAEVHPYAKIAWWVLSSAYKVISVQRERDAKVLELLSIMNDVYGFMNDAKLTEKIPSQEVILKRIAQQTIECAHFVTSYSKDCKFIVKAGKHIFSDADVAIKMYKDKFTELTNAFNTKAILQTEITVLGIASNVADLITDVDLMDMPYARGAAFQSGKQCLAGTRVNLLEQITKWITDTNDERRVCILAGPAGTGKSAIAHTIARTFDDFGRLGSSFCFDRNNLASRQPKFFFPTLVRDLAGRDPLIKSALGNAIHDNASVRNTEDLQDQFRKLVLASTTELSMTGPIVVVVDALDESGDAGSRRAFVIFLTKYLQELPCNFRIFITSRLEDDIITFFRNKDNIFFIPMPLAHDDASIHCDIHAYISAQFVDNLGEFQDLDGAQCDELATRSEGLFQWAFVACDFIKGDGKAGLTPLKRYNRLMSQIDTGNSTRKSATAPLDSLYKSVLSQVFDVDDEEVIDLFRSVMGLVLIAYEPLSASSLRKLWQNISGRLSSIDEVFQVLRYMGSLLSGVSDQSDLIRLLHTSFRDYLTDYNRSEMFYVEPTSAHQLLLACCLASLKESLSFNICRLETSYEYTASWYLADSPNNGADSVRTRIAECIPKSLQYACRFWGRHLGFLASGDAAFKLSQDLCNDLKEILHEKFLFWLEALSLLGELNVAYAQLSSVTKTMSEIEQELADFAVDGQTFLKRFMPVMSESTPHIYLSTLPFTPAESLIYKHYAPHYPRVCKIFTEPLPTASSNASRGHTDSVISIAFSPDGTRIVSGSGDKTLRLWNAATGELLLGPIQGHQDDVSSVAFSSDGMQIISGSCDMTIRVWDAQTGESLLQPFRGHTDIVHSVVFSPDGSCIASCSGDYTIRLWDAETGVESPTLFWGHMGPVYSVAFSLDGQSIVSGSQDKQIILWDVQTGERISAFQCSVPVWSVAFWPGENSRHEHIVSGHGDGSIGVWDATTWDRISKPFSGHTRGVEYIAFSPDGKWMASGSQDGTLRTWNAETGEPFLEPFRGHAASLRSGAFSPDGKQIACGSDDCMISIWNADLRDQSSQQFTDRYSTGKASMGLALDCREKGVISSNLKHLPVVAFSSHLEHALCGMEELYEGQDEDPTNALGTIHFDRESGWIFGPRKELILRIPREHRKTLGTPRLVRILGERLTELDLSQFPHGRNWQSCQLPLDDN